MGLPYSALVHWPLTELDGQQDWVTSVLRVESWLEARIGAHYQRWDWGTWTLHQPDLCSVVFLREEDATLFLLRWDNLRD